MTGILWWLICAISYKRVFGAKTRKVATRKPAKSPFGGFSRGDLSPRQAKIRQTVAENATHGMSRTFVWRGERSPCENTKESPFGGFSCGDLSPRQAKIRPTVAENATHEMSRTFVWQGERSPCENTKKSLFGGFSRGAFSPYRPENDNTKWHKSATIGIQLLQTGEERRHQTQE